MRLKSRWKTFVGRLLNTICISRCQRKKKNLHVCVSATIMLQQSSAASIGAVSGDSEAINVFLCCCFLSALYCQAEEKGADPLLLLLSPSVDTDRQRHVSGADVMFCP